MPKSFSKIIVLGASSIGKTTIIEQIVYGNYNPEKEMHPTIEDSYDAWVDADRGQKERIRIFDVKGLDLNNLVLPFHHIQVADAFMLVFSVTSRKSLTLVEHLKKEIERIRGKDFPIVVLGTKVDVADARECEHSAVVKWANSERIKMFEVLPMNRNTLQEPLTYLVKKISSNIGKRNADVKGIFRRGVGKNFKESMSES
ncbi:NF-kappa-B inhibitor-interacting Ras-like protein 1 [Hydractinia symbiolongicarpus]|uniref:NF-kappa-B inhibitor-interacting Ras-like protein 1 n=1 Tax=Hydractinia symbiolongicarpus TaxID=13093 RepID=UPI002550EEFA|nr:NF-kappa-B inhibitor-interacting Ras-like protein 1 [Hydractinia symbiolongicarpus]